jgi:hypothetical protein
MSYFGNRQLCTNPVDSFARKYNSLRASGLQDE